MRIWNFLITFLIVFSLSACMGVGGGSSSGLLNYKSTISTDEVNEAFSKVFPLQKKSTFGSLVFRKALLKPSAESDRVALSVAFVLTTFEIPEGTEAVMTLAGGLRYDPRTKRIYLTQVTPLGITFKDPSLAVYVSSSVRQAINTIAIRELNDIEIYHVKETFSAKFIKNIVVHKGKIVIQYGL